MLATAASFEMAAPMLAGPARSQVSTTGSEASLTRQVPESLMSAPSRAAVRTAAPPVGAVATQKPNRSRSAIVEPTAARTPTAGSPISR